MAVEGVRFAGLFAIKSADAHLEHVQREGRVGRAIGLFDLTALRLRAIIGTGQRVPRLAFTAFNSHNLTPFLPNGFGGVTTAAAAIFFACIGFDAVSCAGPVRISTAASGCRACRWCRSSARCSACT
jgi:hypothetical protein